MNKIHVLSDLDRSQQPLKINFPYHFTPHPWAIAASKQLQHYLKTDAEMQSYFDETDEASHVGKMFGVLVVELPDTAIGFLAGFSGKLGESNLHEYFVPPVFDILNPEFFFLEEVEVINQINRRIEALEQDTGLLLERDELKKKFELIESELEAQRKFLKQAKIDRDAYRKQLDLLTEEGQSEAIRLNEESAIQHIKFKRFKREKDKEKQVIELEIKQSYQELKTLKHRRMVLSNELQIKLFQEFKFLNAHHQKQDLYHLFNERLGVNPPAGAGECAAPKLFQYAYLNQLKPLTFAEFWWGQSPKSEVRHHGVFYPSCQGKCKPILTHMLEGLEVEENPLLLQLKEKTEEIKELNIIYEDEVLLLVEKPAGFLSVPGKEYEDSILTRLQKMYPNATGSLLLHRLDMATSGLLLAAKEKRVHQLLQQQFEDRKVIKRYDAILNGVVFSKKGTISLPIRVDLNNRPRQIVDAVHGKEALTKYEVVEEKNGKTRIHFWPITGRTHQLRVHASHENGLNVPVVGDVLYGEKADRLYLHAAYLSFYHPVKKKQVAFELNSNFHL